MKNRRPPFYKQLWDKLSPEQKNDVFSFYWAASVQFFVIVLLMILLVPSKAAKPFIITASIGHDNYDAVQSFEISNLAEPILEETPLEAVAIPALAEPVSLPEPTLVSLQTPVVDDAPQSSPQPSPATSTDNALHPTDLSTIQLVNQRVKNAGGNLNGTIRASLMFDGIDDLDLHVTYEDPRSSARFGSKPYHIWFAQARTEHGMLDVDANGTFIMPQPCENIVFFDNVLHKAKYVVSVHLYRWRSGAQKIPYVVTIQHGKTSRVSRSYVTPNARSIRLYEFTYP